jgi:hypothetical protein
MEPKTMQALHREADALIRQMYTGMVGWTARERAHEQKLHAGFASVRGDDAAAAALHRLVHGLQGSSRLVAIEPVLGSLGPQAGNTGLDALLHFARFHEAWLRAPEEWRPETEDVRAQVGSLARHLFARYSLPGFLDAGWLSGFDDQAEAERGWFVHLGQGGKLEAIEFPVPMTHRAAHHFLQAPEEFGVVAAMRYGQIRSLGGSEALARAVAETFLAEIQSDEPFWISVLHFLVNHPRFPLSQVGPVLDYVRFRKFGGDGDPSFTMKGRTAEALLRSMQEWHDALARLTGDKKRRTWSPAGFEPLDKVQKDPFSTSTCHWRIVELTDTLSLAEEGRALRHCVRSYADACYKGTTSIWSLRLTFSDNPTPRRLLTIQVNNQRRSLVQVRGNCNQPLAAMRDNRRMMLARDILREWARKQHLGIACSL